MQLLSSYFTKLVYVYATGRKEENIYVEPFKTGTWNVRELKEYGKLNTVCNEMKRCNTRILDISETNWKGQGSFKTQKENLVLFSGTEENYSHGVAVI